ncbi:hypothetical protein PHLCEN_2v11557 [Hermanssonia centrifuga]|uniref:Uncharacterized protein n=1 Tax=Hermanssonia centrifuga TaxID=98765 RepID=A0A2R6NJM1_9APHY|nr:hypothetical protein PHLCEN_2v11557 [Hermanssonia centrifuga]
MVRQLYDEQVYTNKEIAEFLGCDTKDVHYAIHNELNDDVDEDRAYLEGRRGDLINVDRYDSPSPFGPVKAEEVEVEEVDMKLGADFILAGSDAGDNSEVEVETDCQ